MELHEFAERILFATTLDEKLACPADITDERQGPALMTPATPGRPRELRFKPAGGGKTDFPGLHRLDREIERGRLLHFFANHELLATELMALVLLKFPDAPPAFRQGVLQTLKDEQIHTRLYLKRMKECGLEFGALPVSGFFWRAVSPMESPLDYVAGLSLTFEQANLDFCRHFARGFSSAGDAATARLLEKIHRDEIGHVACGLKWFRRWKDPKLNDWDAFCRQLKFPLSPQRAKGITLNVEARRAAGLDPAFIEELSVYAKSKGRTPSVHVFNPFAEGFIAQGRRFTPAKHQAALVRDLENLPQFLCRQDDVVVVSKRPSVSFLASLQAAGFPLPEFVELDAVPALAARKLGGLRPWAWVPDSVRLLAPLFPSVTGDTRCADEYFHEGIAKLYSKAWSAAFLAHVLKEQSSPVPAPVPSRPPATTEVAFDDDPTAWLCTGHEAGVAVTTLDDALGAVEAIRARGHHRIVVKQAFGLAGQNAIRLWEPALLATQRRWMERALENGHPLVVEPWLERAADFSVQLEMTAERLELRGYTGLINDQRGQFQANWAEPNHARRVPAAVAKHFSQPEKFHAGLALLYRRIVLLLESELKAVGFRGPLGIDALVYRTAGGRCRLKPIVEINPRYTMGRVTIELMKHVAPGRRALFRLVNRQMLRASGFADFPAYARALERRFPVQLAGEPVAKMATGAACLNDAERAETCLAVLRVGPPGEAVERAIEV